MTVLAAQGLSKSYGGVQALRGVSFTVGAGERVALIGPNGAGKTTCFNLLNGQARPDAGRIELERRDITGLAPHAISRLGVARTFQVAATFGSMTVRENVQVALLAHRRGLASPLAFAPRLHASEAEALLERAGIRALAARACAELAYGDLKRVELAIALASRPRLMLMDEPTSGMAPRERGALMRLVSSLAGEAGAAVLFTEHDMDIVFGHAERILVLDHGELIASGTPAEVQADPRVQEVYLGHA